TILPEESRRLVVRRNRDSILAEETRQRPDPAHARPAQFVVASNGRYTFTAIRPRAGEEVKWLAQTVYGDPTETAVARKEMDARWFKYAIPNLYVPPTLLDDPSGWGTVQEVFDGGVKRIKAEFRFVPPSLRDKPEDQRVTVVGWATFDPDNHY